MAPVCPRCAAPAKVSAEAAGAACPVVRCARCGMAWFRHGGERRCGADGNIHSPAAKPSRRPRFERVIEHVASDFASTPGATRQTPRAGLSSTGNRQLALWSSVVVIILVVIPAMLSFEPSLRRMVGEAGPRHAGLEVRLLHSGVEPVRNGRALAVLGEIANRTTGEMRVPAVRLSLRSDGAELYSSLVEPTTSHLAAGHAVLFRSVIAAPPAGIDEVAFGLAERRDTIIGMR